MMNMINVLRENREQIEKEGESLSEELNKKYTPRKPIICNFHVKNYDLLKISTHLILGIKNKEHYLQNPLNLEIGFT